ncbi:terpene synthase family protein [Pseudomonas chlororaphis]|uniref:terpene synthase family protein n=1 Tax=Pseudomonas chlororaphis TaxID=587753 RepID=UPI002D77FBE8|nr:terpene cyclase [Pseudomonas chlororaphis]
METSSVIQMSASYNPFKEPRIHPKTDEADAKATAFGERYELYWDTAQKDRILHQFCGGLAGYLFPDASEDLLQIAADFSMFAFAWDDQYCDEGPERDVILELSRSSFRLLRTIESLETVVYPEDNYAMALRDISLRVRKHTNTYQYLLWVDSLRNWFYMEQFKTAHVQRGVLSNLSEYCNTRMYSGASLSYIHLNHIVAQLDFSSDMLADRRVYALTEITQVAANWASDLFAFRKEAARSPDGNNAVNVISREYGCSMHEGFDIANRMLDRMINRFVVLRDEVLKSEHHPLVPQFIDVLETYIVGCIAWCQIATRYLFVGGTDNGEAVFASPGFTQSSSDVSTEPLPIPSIAWWWHVGEPTGPSRLS